MAHDPLRHPDLTSTETIMKASELASHVYKITCFERAYPTLLALGAFFLAVCAHIDVDSLDAFEQIADAIDSGEVDLAGKAPGILN